MVKMAIVSITAAWLFAYASVWVTCAVIDARHCEAYGAVYDSTSWGLAGYCLVSGVRINAANLRYQR